MGSASSEGLSTSESPSGPTVIPASSDLPAPSVTPYFELPEGLSFFDNRLHTRLDTIARILTVGAGVHIALQASLSEGGVAIGDGGSLPPLPKGGCLPIGQTGGFRVHLLLALQPAANSTSQHRGFIHLHRL